MDFLNSKINVTRFKFEEPVSLEELKNALPNFAAPKLNIVDEEIVAGWSCAEDPTSVDFSECIIAEKYLCANMRIAQKKLPSGLFKMMVAKEFNAWKKETGKEFIPSKTKREIKELVKEQLLPKIAPTVKNIWVIFDDKGNCFAGTVSNKEKSIFEKLTFDTIGVYPAEQDFENIFADTSSSAFMTDIFRMFDTTELENRSFTVHSPYRLDTDDEKIGMSGFALDLSPELNAALKSGKEFSKIRLSVSAELFEKYLVAGFLDERDIFSFTLNGNGSFSGLVLPECDTVIQNELISERVELLKSLGELIDAMAKEFVRKCQLPDYAKTVHEWITER